MSGYGAVRGAIGSGAPANPYGRAEEELTTLWVGNVPPGTLDEHMAMAFGIYGGIVCCFLLKKLSPQGQLSGFVRYNTRLEAHLALDAVAAGQVQVNGATVTAKWASQNSKPLSGAAPSRPAAPPPAAAPGVQARVTDLILQAITSTSSSPGLGGPGTSASAPSRVSSSSGEDITTLWVGNVTPGTSDEEMAAVFGTYGQMLSCFLLHKLSPQGQISGFVRYASKQDAAGALAAVEAGQVILGGSVVRARWASENSKVTKGMGELNSYSAKPAGQFAPSGTDDLAAQALQVLQQSLHPTSAWQAPGTDPAAQALQALQGLLASTSGVAPPGTDGPSTPVGPDAFDNDEISTLWVGNVPPGTGDDQMAASFRPYGQLLCCFLLRKLSPQGQLSGFVRYVSRLEAQFALESVSRGEIVVNGSAVSGKWASQNSKPLNNPSFLSSQASSVPEPPPLKDGEEITTLWLGNAKPETTDRELAEGLRPYGQLVCCFLLKKLSPKGQMSGFVRYSTQAEARLALEAMTSGRVIVNQSIISAKWAQQNSKPRMPDLDTAPSRAPAPDPFQEALSSIQGNLDPAVLAHLQDPSFLQTLQALLGSAGLIPQQPRPLGMMPPPQPLGRAAWHLGSGGEEISTLQVGGTPAGVTDTEFAQTMGIFGQLVCCFLLNTVSADGHVTGFAQYSTRSEASLALQAIEANTVAIRGSPLVAAWARDNSKPLR